METVAALSTWALSICPSPSAMWLTERLQGTANGNVSDLFQLFSAAGRRMGSAPVGQAPAEVARTALITDAWTQEDLARVSGALAWWSAALPEDRRATLEDLYYRGSGLEKRAVLLALPALDEPEGCLDLAVEACRTNSLEVFCAIACDNAYPGLHFPELPMNQMVLKALFLGLNVDRVMGLEPRITPQLLTDVRQFKAEREAAGRAVPSGVDWIMNKASRK